MENNSVYSSTSTSTQIPHPLPASLTSADESGWTAYLLDDPSASDSLGTPSLLSDAASHAVADHPAHLNVIPRKLSLKPNPNPKPSQFFIDSSLEDTASSPDNSPKVADLGPFDIANSNYRRKSSLSKGRTMEEKYNNKSGGEINLEMGFKRKAAAYTDLTTRGLCLVPLSMLANYLSDRSF